MIKMEFQLNHMNSLGVNLIDLITFNIGGYIL